MARLASNFERLDIAVPMEPVTVMTMAQKPQVAVSKPRSTGCEADIPPPVMADFVWGERMSSAMGLPSSSTATAPTTTSAGAAQGAGVAQNALPSAGLSFPSGQVISTPTSSLATTGTGIAPAGTRPQRSLPTRGIRALSTLVPSGSAVSASTSGLVGARSGPGTMLSSSQQHPTEPAKQPAPSSSMSSGSNITVRAVKVAPQMPKATVKSATPLFTHPPAPSESSSPIPLASNRFTLPSVSANNPPVPQPTETQAVPVVSNTLPAKSTPSANSTSPNNMHPVPVKSSSIASTCPSVYLAHSTADTFAASSSTIQPAASLSKGPIADHAETTTTLHTSVIVSMPTPLATLPMSTPIAPSKPALLPGPVPTRIPTISSTDTTRHLPALPQAATAMSDVTSCAHPIQQSQPSVAPQVAPSAQASNREFMEVEPTVAPQVFPSSQQMLAEDQAMEAEYYIVPQATAPPSPVPYADESMSANTHGHDLRTETHTSASHHTGMDWDFPAAGPFRHASHLVVPQPLVGADLPMEFGVDTVPPVQGTVAHTDVEMVQSEGAVAPPSFDMDFQETSTKKAEVSSAPNFRDSSAGTRNIDIGGAEICGVSARSSEKISQQKKSPAAGTSTAPSLSRSLHEKSQPAPSGPAIVPKSPKESSDADISDGAALGPGSLESSSSITAPIAAIVEAPDMLQHNAPSTTSPQGAEGGPSDAERSMPIPSPSSTSSSPNATTAIVPAQTLRLAVKPETVRSDATANPQVDSRVNDAAQGLLALLGSLTSSSTNSGPLPADQPFTSNDASTAHPDPAATTPSASKGTSTGSTLNLFVPGPPTSLPAKTALRIQGGPGHAKNSPPDSYHSSTPSSLDSATEEPDEQSLARAKRSCSSHSGPERMSLSSTGQQPLDLPPWTLDDLTDDLIHAYAVLEYRNWLIVRRGALGRDAVTWMSMGLAMKRQATQFAAINRKAGWSEKEVRQSIVGQQKDPTMKRVVRYFLWPDGDSAICEHSYLDTELDTEEWSAYFDAATLSRRPSA